MKKHIGPWIRAFYFALVVATSIGILSPFSASGPVALNGERYAADEAIARHLTFGKDFIFTYGPYSSIYTGAYHPATDRLTIFGSLVIAICYGIAILLLTPSKRAVRAVAFCLVLATLVQSRDAYLLSYPLVAALACLAMSSLESWRSPRRLAFSSVLLAAPLGLLPLVKGTMLLFSGTVAVFSAIFLVLRRQRTAGLAWLLAPALAMLFFWQLAGQPFDAIPAYLNAMSLIVSGYSEAMAIYGNALDPMTYVGAVLVMMTVLVARRLHAMDARLYLCSIFAVYLFIGFKGGFVRQDGHIAISGSCMLIAAMLLGLAFDGKAILTASIVGMLAWLIVDGHSLNTSTSIMLRNFHDTYTTTWLDLKHRLKDKQWAQENFNEGVAALRTQADFPPLTGTSDIYSYDQPYLIASGYAWSPRPVIQSYTAYTETLANVNRQHLLSDQAPENVIFRVEPIDLRLPSLEDGASWPVLLRNYHTTIVKNGFLFLRRNDVVATRIEVEPEHKERHRLDETVTLPDTDRPLFVKFEIQPTLWGHIVGFLYKPDQLSITLNLANGRIARYRFVANMAGAGIVLSPLIESTDDFRTMYDGPHRLYDKRVLSFSISSEGGGWSSWQRDYSMRYTSF